MADRILSVLAPVLPYYLLSITLVTLLLFGADKRRAKKGSWRIPEKTLFLFAAIGGSVGAIFGMRIFHHKTRHPSFRYGIPAILLLQIALSALLLWKK